MSLTTLEDKKLGTFKVPKSIANKSHSKTEAPASHHLEVSHTHKGTASKPKARHHSWKALLREN